MIRSLSAMRRSSAKVRRKQARRDRRLAIELFEERTLLAAAPVGQDDTFVLGSATASTSFGTVLANDHDADGDGLSALLENGPSQGTLSLDSDGTFLYTPGAGFQGIDSFTYRANDGALTSEVTTTYLVSQQANTVRKLYEQVLGRDPERGGWDYWTDRIRAGTASLGTVASGIFESSERLNPIIAQMYRDYLFREVDEAGLNYWREAIWKRDGGPDNVIAGIVSSDEFYQSAGATNPGWVTEMYRRLLGREPDQGGLNYWTNQLNSGAMNRPNVVLGFVRSEENFHILVKGWHVQYLGRPATWTEEEIFAGQLQSGASERSIQIQILDSPEYIATLLSPEPGQAAPADISGFGVTDDNGIVNLQAGGRPFSFQLFDEQSGAPLREYAASLVLDPETRGVGVLTLIDIRGSLPPKIVVVVDGDASANVQPRSLAAPKAVGLPIPISVSKAVDGVIEVVTKSVFSSPVYEKVGTALKLKDLTLLGLKTATGLGVVNLDLGATQTEKKTAADAMVDINDDLLANLFTTALLFRTLGPLYELSAAGVAADLGNFAIDAATVLACANDAGSGVAHVTVTTVPGLGKIYACDHDDDPLGDELVSVQVPTPSEMTTGSLELLSQANLGQGYYAQVQSGNNFNLNVKPGRYRAIIRSPGFDPKITDIDVPQGELSLVLSLNPGSSQRISIQKNQSQLMRLNTDTDYNILLATASGGFPPYTFTLDSGIGFQPQGMTLVTEGDKLYLRGRPSEGSANPFVRKFGVCVKDLRGASDCVDTPFSYIISTPGILINPASGLITTEAGGTASFTVALGSRPESNVTIGLSSANTAEGTLSTNSVTFTPDNWHVPQTVVITGVDDLDVDGNVAYEITTAPAVSADPAYNGRDAQNLVVVNVDNDVPGPTPDTTGTWRGTFEQSNPLGTQSGVMILTLRAFPQFTTVVTGTIFLEGGGTRNLRLGTVSGSKFVFDIPTSPGFLFHQLTGSVNTTTMIGKSILVDSSGGETRGTFTLFKVA